MGAATAEQFTGGDIGNKRKEEVEKIMTLAQIDHAATLSDPLLSDTLYRLKRACRDHDAEVDLAGRVERLMFIASDYLAQRRKYEGMLAESRQRLQRCEADILSLARLLVKEAEVTE